MKWINEKDELERLINVEHVSYEEIGRRYDVSGANIKKVAKKLGIELPKRRKINEKENFNRGTAKTGKCLNCGREFIIYKSYTGKFCSHDCINEYKKNEYIKKWKNGEIDGTTNTYSLSVYVRNYILNKANYRCEKCGWNEINPVSGQSPLQIHHIDGDCTNNKEENLQVLCPNCHSLTENYGALNKNANKGRAEYFHYGKEGYYERIEKRKKKFNNKK